MNLIKMLHFNYLKLRDEMFSITYKLLFYVSNMYQTKIIVQYN